MQRTPLDLLHCRGAKNGLPWVIDLVFDFPICFHLLPSQQSSYPRMYLLVVALWRQRRPGAQTERMHRVHPVTQMKQCRIPVDQLPCSKLIMRSGISKIHGGVKRTNIFPTVSLFLSPPGGPYSRDTVKREKDTIVSLV